MRVSVKKVVLIGRMKETVSLAGNFDLALLLSSEIEIEMSKGGGGFLILWYLGV